MGHRLTKIYTRTGDKGETGLGDGRRIAKDNLRVETFGTVDELNSLIGMILAYQLPVSVCDRLTEIQHSLFDLGGELCLPGHTAIQESHVTQLEETLDEFNAELPALKDFILPAGGHATATCHLARAVCRRAERRAVSLEREESLNPWLIAYMNRLSDLLFVIARVLARYEGGKEVLWQANRGKHD